MAQRFFDFIVSSAGQTMVQNILAILALIFAVRGVRNWNQERRDLRRAELAEKSLVAAYRVRDAFSFIRSAFATVGEGSSRPRQSDEDMHSSAALDSAFTPLERMNRMIEIFEEVRSLRYSVTAAFGAQAAAPLGVFLDVRHEVIVAAQARMRDVHRNLPITEASIARQEKYESVIWEGVGDEEKITPRLEKAISDLEAAFRPYVEATLRPLFRYWWDT